MRLLFGICLLLFFYLPLNAQVNPSISSCTNSDFESGDLTGWNGGTGYCCPINTSASQIIAERHTIMTGNGTDAFTCNMVPIVAPGGLFSARLGNSNSGNEAESLSYSLTVTSSSTLFIYRYAVVLEDPGHEPEEQPRFQVQILDQNGNLLDPTCGLYTVAAADGLDGFNTCDYGGSLIRYRNWTTVGLNLTPYLGQNITLEFSTGDCSRGGHFGYAYVDAYCSPLTITANYCTGAYSAELTAPIGFEYLWNTGETSQSIEVNNPIEGQTFSCHMTSVTGCTVDISTSLFQVDPAAEFTMTNSCYNNAIFTNTSFTPAGIYFTSYLWDFGDGTTATTENATHQFPTAGTYDITYTIGNARGCSSVITHQITVVDPPTAAITFDNSAYCISQTTAQPIVLSGTGPYLGGIFSADPALVIDSTTGTIKPWLSTPGHYVVSYKIPTTDNCTVPDITIDVSITAVPTASIQYNNAIYCESEYPQNVTLIGTGTYLNGSFNSDSGLIINSNSGIFTPTLSQPGNYIITYTVPAFGGCAAIPVTTGIVLNPLPKPEISDGRICIDSDGTTFRSVLLDTGLNNNDYDFVWTYNGTIISDANQSTFNATNLGNFAVTVTNINTGCVAVPVVAMVSETQTPIDFYLSLSNSFTGNATITVTVNEGTGPFLYQLDDGLPQESNLFYDPKPGIRNIRVTDIYGCTDMTSQIAVMEYPKIFTPNDDGYADRWNIRYLSEQTSAKICIFDRFGKLLKQLAPNGDGWDGTYNGTMAPSTDYWFTVDYQVTNKEGQIVWEQFKAHFALKR